jgi:hypothetical protein
MQRTSSTPHFVHTTVLLMPSGSDQFCLSRGIAAKLLRRDGVGTGTASIDRTFS